MRLHLRGSRKAQGIALSSRPAVQSRLRRRVPYGLGNRCRFERRAPKRRRPTPDDVFVPPAQQTAATGQRSREGLQWGHSNNGDPHDRTMDHSRFLGWSGDRVWNICRIADVSRTGRTSAASKERIPLLGGMLILRNARIRALSGGFLGGSFARECRSVIVGEGNRSGTRGFDLPWPGLRRALIANPIPEQRVRHGQ